jgi:alpha-glucosidase
MGVGIRFGAAALCLSSSLAGCVVQGGGYQPADAGPSMPADATLGSYQVQVDVNGAFAVRHAGNHKRVLSASPAATSFVEALRVDDKVTEASGSFTITENVRARCSSMQDVHVDKQADELSIAGTLSCDGKEAAFKLSFSEKSENVLALKLTLESEFFNQVALHQAARPEEHFVGFGEQFSYLDLRGHAFPVIVEEGGVGRLGPIADQFDALIAGTGGTAYSTYAPMPYYMTSEGRAFLLENDEVSYFDLTPEDRSIVRVRGKELRALLLFGEQPADVLRELTAITGRMPKLPDWIHQGAIVGMQGGTQRVYEVLAQLEAHDTPLAAFWLQDWVGKRRTPFGSRLWWNWQLNEDHYPGWSTLVSNLGRKGVRVLTYVNPYLVDVGDDPAFSRNLYGEAAQAGFLVKAGSGDPYSQISGTFEFGVVDLTNERAARWLKDVIREEVLGTGASGYMADFGEALAFDAKVHAGDATALHNRFPDLWAKLNREVLEEEGLEGEAVFFSRAGYTQAPRYSTLFWAGDQMVTWDEYDGIKSGLTGLLSGGLSGISLNHTDIGGYTAFGVTLRSKELLMRWIELAAFTTVFRTHEGNQPSLNAQIYDDAESLAQFAHFARIFASLAGYRERLMEEAARTGMPLVRPLLLVAPEDPEAWTKDREFMLGNDLLIAPVLDKAATKVSAYLPAGTWIHLWSGTAYEAGEVLVEAPVGQPGVFYRQGSEAGEALHAVQQR